jgi:hypothetical protein
MDYLFRDNKSCVTMTAIALLWPVLLVCLYEVLDCSFGLADS